MKIIRAEINKIEKNRKIIEKNQKVISKKTKSD